MQALPTSVFLETPPRRAGLDQHQLEYLVVMAIFAQGEELHVREEAMGRWFATA
jgi:hypothetical protein